MTHRKTTHRLILTSALLGLTALPVAGLAATPEDPGTAARATVERYYSAIGQRDYGTAYDLWEDGGAASGQSLPGFAAGYGDTARVTVRTGDVADIEGAAGSLYATVPVTIEATMADGRTEDYSGSYILRRSNDVPGGSDDWHIFDAEIAARG